MTSGRQLVTNLPGVPASRAARSAESGVAAGRGGAGRGGAGRRGAARGGAGRGGAA
jgi:hypothetical protein